MPAGPAADAFFMRRALALAAKGLGRTSPNPAVGAVVVAEGRIIGEGWHKRAGEPHAEPLALAEAGAHARGATLYVTLEPCCHHGRTPPCTDAIMRAGVLRVFYACPDCDKRSAGRAASILAEAGVEVACGPLTEEAQRLNEAYFKHKATGLPFVTLKLACSLDGKTATRTGDSKWISGEESRLLVHQMRDRSDAVMVGIGTVLADDPQLTTRAPGGGGRDALRVMVDSQARTPPDAKVIAQDSDAGCLIAVAENAPPERIAALREAGADVWERDRRSPFPATRNSPLATSLPSLMAELGRRGIMSVLLEGGATLAAGAVEAGIVDKVVFFFAPKLIGGTEAPPAIAGLGVDRIANATSVEITAVQRVGDDIMVEAYPRQPD